MNPPHLYLQLLAQFSQWIQPADRRHLQGYAELVSAILQSKSACPTHWLPYLSHRNCQARSHLERIHYFLHNSEITDTTFYVPLLQHCLQNWQNHSITLVLDTSLLWNQSCIVAISCAWGGRSILLAQTVLEHGSATVAFDDYRPILEAVESLLPPKVKVQFLADRGFDHGDLMRWLNQKQWNWMIRAKSDLLVQRQGQPEQSVAVLLPPPEQAYLYHNVTIIQDVNCHLATAHWPKAKEAWAVFTSQAPSLQTFAQYGQRFGGIEPMFKDFKSAAFELPRSHIRHAGALNRLLMLLSTAHLLALQLATITLQTTPLTKLDWHHQRGLSFLQIGLRALQQLLYQGCCIPRFTPLPYGNPPPAVASLKKKQELEERIEFSRVTVFSF
jgi:Transposase DDE domain